MDYSIRKHDKVVQDDTSIGAVPAKVIIDRVIDSALIQISTGKRGKPRKTKEVKHEKV